MAADWGAGVTSLIEEDDMTIVTIASSSNIMASSPCEIKDSTIDLRSDSTELLFTPRKALTS